MRNATRNHPMSILLALFGVLSLLAAQPAEGSRDRKSTRLNSSHYS